MQRSIDTILHQQIRELFSSPVSTIEAPQGTQIFPLAYSRTRDETLFQHHPFITYTKGNVCQHFQGMMTVGLNQWLNCIYVGRTHTPAIYSLTLDPLNITPTQMSVVSPSQVFSLNSTNVVSRPLHDKGELWHHSVGTGRRQLLSYCPEATYQWLYPMDSSTLLCLKYTSAGDYKFMSIFDMERGIESQVSGYKHYESQLLIVDEFKFCVVHIDDPNSHQIIDLFDRRVLRSVGRLQQNPAPPQLWGSMIHAKSLNSNQILVTDYESNMSSYEVIDIRKGSVAREIVNHGQEYVQQIYPLQLGQKIGVVTESWERDHAISTIYAGKI